MERNLKGFSSKNAVSHLPGQIYKNNLKNQLKTLKALVTPISTKNCAEDSNLEARIKLLTSLRISKFSESEQTRFLIFKHNTLSNEYSKIKHLPIQIFIFKKSTLPNETTPIVSVSKS